MSLKANRLLKNQERDEKMPVRDISYYETRSDN